MLVKNAVHRTDTITPQMKILVAVEPADFRRGIDGLARLCQEKLQHDPFTGTVFVFRNRKGTAVKVLMYDGQGSGSATSGFHRAVFPGGPRPVPIAAARRLAAHQLAVLLSAGNPEATGLPRTGVRSARGVDLSACPLAGGRPSYFIDQHDRKMPARPYASGRCAAPFVPVVVGCRRTRDYRSGPHAAGRRCIASRRRSTRRTPR